MKDHSDHTTPQKEKPNSSTVDNSVCEKPAMEGKAGTTMQHHPDHTGKPAPRVND